MIKYEDLKLPCLTLANFIQPESNIVTQFDYAKRVRRGKMPNPSMSFRVVLDTTKDKETFGKFYYTDLDSGVDTFLLDQSFGLYSAKDKTVRFSAPLNISELGDGTVEITSTIELTDPKNASITCTLVPSNALNPDSKLYPNVCPTTNP